LKDAIIHIQKISDSAAASLNPSDIHPAFRQEPSWPRHSCWEIWRRMRHLLKKPFRFWRKSEPCRIPPNLKAEALFEKAYLSSRMGRASAVSPIYLSVITQYPHTPWADRSVKEMIDIHLADPP
jgi:hypothetical protein